MKKGTPKSTFVIKSQYGKVILHRLIDLEMEMSDLASAMNVPSQYLSNAIRRTGQSFRFSRKDWERLFSILKVPEAETEELLKQVPCKRINLTPSIKRMTDEQFDEYIQNLKDLRASSEKD